MEPTTILSTALSTLLGKVAVGTAVAAVSVAGMDAADLVDVPGFDEKPQAVEVGETPPEPGAVVDQTPAAEKADPEADREEESDLEEGETEEIVEDDTEGGEPDANAGFGQAVAEDARDGGVDGQSVAAEARAGTPAEDRADAPEEAGERQDAEVRQDADAPHGDDQAEELRPTDPGTQADEHRPADAGAEANGRP